MSLSISNIWFVLALAVTAIAHTLPAVSVSYIFISLFIAAPSPLKMSSSIEIEEMKLDLTTNSLIIDKYGFQGQIGLDVGSDFNIAERSSSSAHIQWADSKTSLTVTRVENEHLIEFNMEWKTDNLWKLEDKYLIGNGTHWYGGAQVMNQLWPWEKCNLTMRPYVTNDIWNGEYGSVQERYWMSHKRVAVVADEQVPLWYSLQTGNSFVIRAQYSDSIFENVVPPYTRPFLSYKIILPKEPKISLKDFHLYIMKTYFAFPSDIPDERMMLKPIWSTWARYGKGVNSVNVIDFANEIVKNGFENSQLEIDDAWATHYGDMQFDTKKFGDYKQMIAQLKQKGFRITIWTHPFFNCDSDTARNSANNQYMIKDRSHNPIWLSWWNGAGYSIDPTNPEAADWFVNRHKKFLQETGIDSYKFDAGETNSIGNGFRLSNGTFPNYFSKMYVEMVARLGPVIEARIGVKNQHLPVFIRMLDKGSDWGIGNGLRAMITATLTFSILGYPFVLPDMIGGNGYENGYPDKELYIRWMQATVFLPAMQFSFVPWIYDDQVVTIAQQLMQLRRKYETYILKTARQSVSNGDPMIRPLWWIDESENGLTCDSQFLLGDQLMAAPILYAGQTQREVYIPVGKWKCAIDEQIYEGPVTITQKVLIDQIAYYLLQ